MSNWADMKTCSWWYFSGNAWVLLAFQYCIAIQNSKTCSSKISDGLSSCQKKIAHADGLLMSAYIYFVVSWNHMLRQLWNEREKKHSYKWLLSSACNTYGHTLHTSLGRIWNNPNWGPWSPSMHKSFLLRSFLELHISYDLSKPFITESLHF
jgi:hypothetical protein